MTSISDDFNRANSTDLGAGWVEVSGDWSIVSSQLSPGSAGGTIILRAATALASSDHYAQATIAATTAASHGVWCRGNSNITSGYLFRNDGSSWNLFSVIGGSFSSIGSYAAAAAPGDVVKIQAVGSTIKGLVNGIERVSVTDTGVTTGTSVGIRSESSGSIKFDDFSAADVTAGATLAVATTTETAQPLTGAKAVTLGVAGATESAQPLTGSKAATLSPAAATHTAQPVTGVKTRSLGDAASSETAQALAGTKATPLGTAGASESAQQLLGNMSAALGTASAVHTGQALAGAKTGALSVAAATETAQTLTGAKTGVLVPAAQTEAAQALASAVGPTLGTAAAIETARPLTGGKSALLGPALERSTAQSIAAPGNDDVDITVGAPYSPWAVGQPYGSAWTVQAPHR